MGFCSWFAFAALLACASAGAINRDLCSDVGAISNLVLAENNRILSASWTAPAGTSGCDVTYRLSVKNNANEMVIEKVITQTSIVFEETLVPCSTVEVTVTPVGAEDGASSTSLLTAETSQLSAPVLDSMMTSCNSIEMIWKGQSHEENMCEVTHFQMWCISPTHSFTLAQNIKDRFDRTFDILITVLEPDTYYVCNGYIFVTLAGFSPASENIEFESNLESVRDFALAETDGVLTASWLPPLNSEDCGVVYEVVFENELGTETFSTPELAYSFADAMVPCTKDTVTVTPISYTTSRGYPSSQTITPEIVFPTFDGVTVDIQETSLVVVWEDFEVGICEIDYQIEHYIDGELQSSESTSDAKYELSKIPCTENQIVVTPAYRETNQLGSPATVELSLSADDISSLGEVRDIKFSYDTIQWAAPLNAGKCLITYDVKVDGPQGELTYNGIEDTSVKVTLAPCSSQTVEVTPYVNDVTGLPLTVTDSTGSSEHTPPEHITTLPDYTGAQITVQGEAFDDNACPIEGALVECLDPAGKVTEIKITVSDKEVERVFLLVVDTLERDTLYSCRIKWDSSTFGDYISFRTAPVGSKDLVADPIGESDFTVSWNEDYAAGTDLVLSYTLIVESTGPKHYVPDRCEVERGEIYSVEVEAGANAHVFKDAFPNYHYNVQLVTKYSFGTFESESLSVDSLPAVPGSPDDLAVEWIYEPGAAYNVEGSVTWSMPCDTHGDLRSFGVNVTSVFQIGDEEVQYEVPSTVEANEPISDIGYSLVFKNVNPMFTYIVSVKTVAEFEGDTRDVIITPPPACNCAE